MLFYSKCSPMQILFSHSGETSNDDKLIGWYIWLLYIWWIFSSSETRIWTQITKARRAQWLHVGKSEFAHTLCLFWSTESALTDNIFKWDHHNGVWFCNLVKIIFKKSCLLLLECTWNNSLIFERLMLYLPFLNSRLIRSIVSKSDKAAADENDGQLYPITILIFLMFLKLLALY